MWKIKGETTMKENKKSLVIYVHGKGGNANEIENYHKFFSGHEFYGFDYKADQIIYKSNAFRPENNTIL